MTPQPDASMSDEELMTAYYEGQDDALGLIHCRNVDWMVRSAYRRLPRYYSSRYQVAEDLVGNTFKLVVATREFGRARWSEEKGLVSTWMRAILVNQTTSLVRVRKGKELVGTDWSHVDQNGRSIRLEEFLADPRGTAELELSYREELAQLFQMLSRLPDEHREIVGLKYFDGLSHAEIGEMYGISVPTVSRRLHESHRRLQKFIERVNDSKT